MELVQVAPLSRRTGSNSSPRTLAIRWQRLVSQGKTCDRCAATEQEVQRAVAILEQVLRPLGMQPQLEVIEIDDESFKANPGESNLISIAGKPMEAWLEGRVGSSRCCSVCGDSECRTVEVSGTTFETIPERLIVRAALIASSKLLDDKPQQFPDGSLQESVTT